MTCMINFNGRTINATKFQRIFSDVIPGSPSTVKRRDGVGFAVGDDTLVMLSQQLQPALAFLQTYKTEIQRMLAFDGVESGCLDFGIRIDLEKIIFNMNNFLPLELLHLATEIGLNIELSFYFGSELMARNIETQKIPQIECNITFLPPEEGGRTKSLPPGALIGGTYRPHLVVDDPRQRKEIMFDDTRLPETYLGVAFREGPKRVKSGETITATLDLIYYPEIPYENLQPGALFTVREGSRTVAYGTILSRTR